MSATTRPIPLIVGAMSPTLRTRFTEVLNKSDSGMIEGFPVRWLGVVFWLRRVSDRWEAIAR
ncbi:hypothetical protein Ate02nite_18230 [Paractinoplanes tereljensis]|uniref:Uncharacterized protein n=1 Tax=Paractinoplanes tereljensis TaxID=571912 RepID=A0A919NJ06_9ACTN|nr:hypothetical protein Ate02nite_18230 [Actinoplanes tereljensis]